MPYKIITLVNASLVLVMVLCFYFYMGISPDFEASSIKIKGNNLLSSSEILKKTGIQPHVNIFRIKPAEIKDRLERDPWIKTATVRRELPNRIVIDLQERKPFIIWMSGADPEGKAYLVDQEGVILKEFHEGDDAGFNLPVLIKESPLASTLIEGEQERAYIQKVIPEIAKILQADIPLFKQIKAITLSRVGNVTLIPFTQTPEVRIHLPAYGNNLEYLKALLPQLDVAHLAYIDLRFKKRVIIKPNNS